MNTGWTLSCSLEALSLGLRQEEGRCSPLVPKEVSSTSLTPLSFKMFYLFLAALGLCCCKGFFCSVWASDCGAWVSRVHRGTLRRTSPKSCSQPSRWVRMCWARRPGAVASRWVRMCWARRPGAVASVVPVHGPSRSAARGSPWTRDGALVSCVDRQIPHWASKEAPPLLSHDALNLGGGQSLVERTSKPLRSWIAVSAASFE